MSTLLLERAPALDEGLEHEPRRELGDAEVTGPTDAHGRLTLDELMTSVWEGLAVRDTVSCPVCSGPMVSDSALAGSATFGSGVREGDALGGARLGGACLGCGSLLA